MFYEIEIKYKRLKYLNLYKFVAATFMQKKWFRLYSV